MYWRFASLNNIYKSKSVIYTSPVRIDKQSYGFSLPFFIYFIFLVIIKIDFKNVFDNILDCTL